VALPIKINLQLSSTQEGGQPYMIIKNINNLTNKFLKGTHGTAIYNFSFNDTNKKETKESTYIGAGSFTAVFGITQIGSTKKLVLRVQDTITEEQNDSFIEKYKLEKNILPNNLPLILFYGELLNTDGNSFVPNYFYTIMEYCNTDFDSLSEKHKILIIKSLCNALEILSDNKYFLHDLKLDNIGFNDRNDAIIIDYDAKTLIKYLNTGVYINDVLTGTYLPCYVMIPSILKYYEFTNYNQFLKEKHDKHAVMGFADIIVRLFFDKLFMNPLKTSYYSDPVRILYSGNVCYDNNDNVLKLNTPKKFCKYDNETQVMKLASPGVFNDTIQNLSDLDKINQYVQFIYSKKDYSSELSSLLKKILFDKDNNKGLLHPDYERITTYKEINKILTEFKSTTPAPKRPAPKRPPPAKPLGTSETPSTSQSGGYYYKKYLKYKKNICILEINKDIVLLI
jgi:serine/threonine protein kinase